MAGVVPSKGRSSSGRKQWTLHDGPRGSLRRLRSQLANDGCSESQVILAKQLFEEQCELEVDKQENARQGVYWLIKASEQGNMEATNLLKNCFETGKGITEHNYLDVKSCINMTQDEKLARKAARDVFMSLSNGEDFITSDQLQRRMLQIHQREETDDDISDEDSMNCISSDSDSEDWSSRVDANIEKLTEDHLVSAAVDYSHGQLPLVNRVICVVDPNLKALDHIPVIHRSVLHPKLALKILYFKLIRLLGRFSLYSLIKSDIHMLTLMLVYLLLRAENLFSLLPMIIYYTSFIVMTVTTFQMLQTKREYQEFRVWSRLFLTYSGGSLNPQEAEFQFVRNNLKPYGHFFAALLINMIIYPNINKQWIPHSEITVIAFCLTFMTLVTFMIKERYQKFPDLVALSSFAVNVLAKYPYDIDPVITQSWRYLDLKVPTFASHIVVNGIEFCLKFQMVFYIFVPFLFVLLAARQSWRGTYKFLIPHCVTLSWLQLVIINSQTATAFGLLRGTLALIGIVFFVPMIGLLSVILPAAALAKWIVTSSLFYYNAAFATFSIVGFAMYVKIAKSRYEQYFRYIQTVIVIATIFLYLSSPLDKEEMTPTYANMEYPESLSWEQYQNFCHQPAWETHNIAQTQILCSGLNGAPVNWNGYVNEVKILSVRNMWKNIFDKLPSGLSQYLHCLFGELNTSDCQNINEIFQPDCELVYRTIQSTYTCNLEKWNTYQFEISTKMQSGMWGKTAEIVLLAEHEFKNFTLGLKPGDKIWFKGELTNALDKENGLLGGIKPHLNLKEIGCLACHNIDLKDFQVVPYKFDVKVALKHIYFSFKNVLNFLLYPVVVFK